MFPKILALAAIIKHPWHYAVLLPTIPNQPLVASVLLPKQISLVEAAGYAGMSLDQLRQFNPAYTQLATPPTHSGTYYLMLPISHVTTFEKNLAADARTTQYYWRQYVVKPGESLSLIANTTGANVTDLIRYNHLNSTTIYPGQSLIYPTVHKTNQYKFYTVRPGDTLTRIAHHNNVSVQQLERWNGLRENSILSIGQRLIIHCYRC